VDTKPVQSRQQALHTGFLLSYSSSVLKMVVTWSSKASANFKRLHDVVFQKIELYITTAVRTLIMHDI
jgi:hypothetical protein